MISKREFEKAYEDYHDRLYSYIAFRLDDTILAEDMVSQVFFKALRNLNSYDREKGNISTWLYSITSNLIIDHYRKDDRCENIEDYENYLSTEFETSEEIDFDDNLNKAHTAMLKIPSKAQEIINLRIYEELSFVEIAKIMGMSESGVKMSYIRGIESIKNSLNIFFFLIFLLK